MQQAGLVLPRSFQVHKKQTPPLVTESNLHDHLIVLAAFHRLSQFVKSSEAPFEIRGVLPVSPPVKWYLFLYRARHRFQLWVEKVVAKPARTDGFVARLADDECPPLDVLMFFHCFLLSPRAFSEDVARIAPSLGKIGGFPLRLAASLIDHESLQLVPTPSQIVEWEERTHTSFAMPISTELDATFEIECPRCTLLVPVPWISMPVVISDGSKSTTTGQGYAQNEFSAMCPACGLVVTKSALKVSKFAKDLMSVRFEGSGKYFPTTTLHPQTGFPNLEQAARLRDTISRFLANPIARDYHWVATFCERMAWSIEEVHLQLQEDGDFKKMLPGVFRQRMGQIFSAYRHDGRFTIDLISAIPRQEFFTEAIADRLGWGLPFERLNADDSQLTIAIARYHAFLDMLARNPEDNMVPTQDIDLVWHTHQLKGGQYEKEIIDLTGRFVDHNDKVEEGALSTAFHHTARMWKHHYGVNYSVCMCQSTVHDLLKGVPPPNDMPQVEATHPSEHNAIHLLGIPHTRRKQGDRERGEGIRRRAIEQKTKLEANVPNMHSAFLRKINNASGRTDFGFLGLAGWAMDAKYDAKCLDVQTPQMGNCCAGAGFTGGVLCAGGDFEPTPPND